MKSQTVNILDFVTPAHLNSAILDKSSQSLYIKNRAQLWSNKPLQKHVLGQL